MSNTQKSWSFHENQVVSIAREAGAAIMDELSNPNHLKVDSKDDDSPVTSADKRANDIILSKLGEGDLNVQSPRGTKLTYYPILSEEMTLEQQQAIMKKGTYWCVDPLDGTKTAIKYAGGEKNQTQFGVLISLVKNGVPVFGVAHYPAEGKADANGKPVGVTYFTSANGKTAYRQEGDEPRQRIRANKITEGPMTMAAGYRGASPAHIAGRAVHNQPSVGGSRILRAAEGKVHVGYMGNHGPISFGYWDLAAPQAILKAAGGELVTMLGGFAEHQVDGALKESKPIRYDGSSFIPGMEGQPYLPACLAAHKDTLKALGMHAISRQVGE